MLRLIPSFMAWHLNRPGKGQTGSTWKKLSIQADFILSDEKIGDYYVVVRRVLTNIFDHREVMAYVTSPAKDSSTRRLFFSTVFPQ